jgi:RNA polymerase sigma-70 factor, ECF subfamily
VRPDPALGLLKLYDEALPHVYGYLLARCGDTGLAEDLTAESFLAAVHAARSARRLVRAERSARSDYPWLTQQTPGAYIPAVGPRLPYPG